MKPLDGEPPSRPGQPEEGALSRAKGGDAMSGDGLSDRPKEDPNRLVRYVAVAAGDGITAGWVLLLVAVEMDVQGFGTLMKTAEVGGLALAVSAGLTAVTFGMLGIAWRVMAILPHED
ncbi:MAG: hypothetical protein AAFP23_10150 [Pseudomonadota bacterium]